MRLISSIGMFCVCLSAQASPPPDSDGKFRDWFHGLSVPGSPDTLCCTVADCRTVDARWNEQTQHYEARVVRELFSNALRNSPLYRDDDAAFEATRSVWISGWIGKFGDTPEAWIEIPQERINTAPNPTGHSVLCWSVFYPDNNGVFCFVPFSAAANEFSDRPQAYG